ncbi:uncharacterized protein J3D65DRAFT_428933 [Phyllosticta citribraziliensis]|uniref:Uncharacterized protein n=1 Tax=Phyllosticta citribraziliensis TaxID=989973 RepID=A0ABR1LI79_9PEZI
MTPARSEPLCTRRCCEPALLNQDEEKQDAQGRASVTLFAWRETCRCKRPFSCCLPAPDRQSLPSLDCHHLRVHTFQSAFLILRLLLFTTTYAASVRRPEWRAQPQRCIVRPRAFLQTNDEARRGGAGPPASPPSPPSASGTTNSVPAFIPGQEKKRARHTGTAPGLPEQPTAAGGQAGRHPTSPPLSSLSLSLPPYSILVLAERPTYPLPSPCNSPPLWYLPVVWSLLHTDHESFFLCASLVSTDDDDDPPRRTGSAPGHQANYRTYIYRSHWQCFTRIGAAAGRWTWAPSAAFSLSLAGRHLSVLAKRAEIHAV